MTRARTQRPRTEAGKPEPRAASRPRASSSAERPRRGPPPPPGAARVTPAPRSAPPGPPPAPAPPRAAPAAGLDPAPRAESVIEDQLVDVSELPDLPILRVAIHEARPALAIAAAAIAATGHGVVRTGSGPEDLDELAHAIASGMIDVVVVGLPGGERLIEAARALAPRSPVVIVASSEAAFVGVARAQTVGAELALTRPYDPERVALVMFAAARLVEQRRELTTARGSEAVLRARLENLIEHDGTGLQPFELFQRVLGLELKRARRYQYPLAVALFALELPRDPAPPAGVRGILRARAGNALVHTIRDIDLATELEHERFLVLLPYTDLTGATGLARRVLAQVASGDPVVAGGRPYAPRFVGAVAGAKPGEPLSFGRLMKDVTRALEQARQDGAELAVQP